MSDEDGGLVSGLWLSSVVEKYALLRLFALL
jgi:hypothetical protein